MITVNQDVLDYLCDLHDQAGEHLKKFRDLQRQMSNTLSGTINPIASVATAPPVPTPSVPVPTSISVPSSEVPKNEKAPVKRNNLSLKEVILEILSRPDHQNGLRSAQIAQIIKSEGVWTSTGNVAQMVSTTIHTLKNDGKLKRGEDKLYNLA